MSRITTGTASAESTDPGSQVALNAAKVAEAQRTQRDSGIGKALWYVGQCLILAGGLYCFGARLTFQMWRPISHKIYRGTFAVICFTYGISLIKTLDGSIPSFFAVLPVTTFQYLMIAILWLFFPMHTIKLFPYTLYAFLHVVDTATTKTSRSGKTKERLSSFGGRYSRSVSRLAAYINFFILVELVLDCFLVRPGAVISLLAYIVFYRIRILYSPGDKEVIDEIWNTLNTRLSSDKTPATVRNYWQRIKAKVEKHSQTSELRQRADEEEAIKRANLDH